jgi:hypothetical protein
MKFHHFKNHNLTNYIFVWSLSNLILFILLCRAFPDVWSIYGVPCVLKLGCNTNFGRWFIITLWNFTCFKNIADGYHRTRDIWTRNVARKSQNVSSDTQMDAVQLRIGSIKSCYKTWTEHSIRKHRNSNSVFVYIPLLLAIIPMVSLFINYR